MAAKANAAAAGKGATKTGGKRAEDVVGAKGGKGAGGTTAKSGKAAGGTAAAKGGKATGGAAVAAKGGKAAGGVAATAKRGKAAGGAAAKSGKTGAAVAKSGKTGAAAAKSGKGGGKNGKVAGRGSAARGSGGAGRGSGGVGGRDLVIVESPAKARTVGQILGGRYVVTASQGHLRDLPKSRIGVKVEEDFEPSYVVVQDKRSLLKELRAAGDSARGIYLATDPDREGEAISWHLQEAAKWGERAAPPMRVVFHEITREAVEEAFRNPREIDMQLVNAQQARRILDRLVGYEISPLLWRRVQRGLSAGRVQSVSLRMVVDREREIAAFVPVESWTLDATLRKADTDAAAGADADGAAAALAAGDGATFMAQLHSVKGGRGRIRISDEGAARGLQGELEGAVYQVGEVRKRDVRQRPAPPFTTSTLQQDAGRKLRYTAQRTMAVAQQLYEGLDVGPGGVVGLITYMRTDSTQVAASAVSEVREYIGERYGREYMPGQARQHSRRSKAAQEAHEAIRPTSIRRDPESLRGYLSADQLNLYTLVWERMLASQMADAVSEATTVDIDAACRGDGGSAGGGMVYNFRATGSVLRFAGFRSVYLEGRDDGGEDGANGRVLPPLTADDALDCPKLEANQHFTEPPPRYTEATLIRAMEERGIGRPSTYAPTIGTLVDRGYVERERNRLTPTALGMTVTDLLTEHFTDVMDLDFTAKMEEELDGVAQGEREWVPMLRDFYAPFHEAVNKANETFSRAEETDEVCDKCGLPMAIKTGRFGRFLACTGYPKCRSTKDMGDNPGAPFEESTEEVCEKCERPMVIRTGRYGRFLACTGYNAEENPCDNRRNLLNKIGVACPDCGGDLVERRARGRGGRPFWGCSRYPACEFIINRRPVERPCPECGKLMYQKNRDTIACNSCDWQELASGAPAPGGRKEELAAVGD